VTQKEFVAFSYLGFAGIHTFQFDIIILYFLKKYYQKFNTINLSQIFLPIKNDLIPAQHAKIPSILGYDLKNLNFIDQEKIIDFESVKKDMELSEILEWEYFFIKLGADLPDLKYDVEYKFVDCFRPFNQFSDQDVHLALKILNEKKSFQHAENVNKSS